MTFRSRKLLDMARDQSCVGCTAEDGTVVPAHANLGALGKGMGHKPSDAAVMHLCACCHAQLDQGNDWSRAEKEEMTYRWVAATLIRLVEQGRLVPR